MQEKKSEKKFILIVFGVICLCLIGILVLSFLNNGSESSKRIADAKNPSLDYLIIVNNDNPYEFGGDYDTELKQSLVYPPDVYGEATPVEKATYVAFSELQHALAKQGMTIGLYSAYRTKEDQQAVCDYYGSLEGWAETNKVMQPGYSEHHTGLVINTLIWYQGEGDESPIWYTETAERQESISYFKLFHETLADYGFIDRYPSGKEDITGVPCEPYEIRFVGSPRVARLIMNNNLTLEEYLAQQH